VDSSRVNLRRVGTDATDWLIREKIASLETAG